jgi:3-dehydroquinate synthase
LYAALVATGVDRRSVVVALGGGVVGDLAGFVAATYMRGIPYVQVPTTLLAAVDSSVGGKVAVDLPEGKNLVGAFYQPRLVVIDPEVLASLPPRELRAGLAEVVKHGVILDAEFFAYVEAHADGILAQEAAVLAAVIRRCCELKARVVSADERDEGLRAILNYGHTFAHALETVTGYQRFRHGEAVALGMVAASLLAEEMGKVAPEVTRRQVALLRRLGLEVRLPAEFRLDELLACFRRDKKTLSGRLRFVLPVGLGEVEVVAEPGEELIGRALERARCV